MYPKNIRDIADRVGSPVEIIAQNEGVKPGVILWEWVKRDDIMDIFRIMEYPENNNMSMILLTSGESIIVDMPHRKLMARIHKFLLTEPQYEFERDETLNTVIITEEKNEEDEA